MQEEPVKTHGNYNELASPPPPPANVLKGLVEVRNSEEHNKIVEASKRLVFTKIDEILGPENKLTSDALELPTTRFVHSDPDHPNWAGYFSPNSNEIVVITDRAQGRINHVKVHVHELLHFFSHNGRDDHERVDGGAPVAKKNNIGFQRNFGLDIREGKEGQITHDYFLAFNEAVTEQLTIDILPEGFDAYDEYRGLLNQVWDDVVAKGLRYRDARGVLKQWTRDDAKRYTYHCFFKGDLDGFTKLLQATYQEYGLTEQQFGLMTHKDDLPTVIERTWDADNPDSPSTPPTPTQVAAKVQHRLNKKTDADYQSDIINDNVETTDASQVTETKYGAEYDLFITERNIRPLRKEVVEGKEYEIDSLGYLIYKGDEAAAVLKDVRRQLDNLVAKAERKEISNVQFSERMDELLFIKLQMSMLSDGFRDFYVQKHQIMDRLAD